MDISKSLAIIALAGLLIFVGPWFTIMALNKVFGMALVIDFWTWLSVFWLQGLLVVRVSK